MGCSTSFESVLAEEEASFKQLQAKTLQAKTLQAKTLQVKTLRSSCRTCPLCRDVERRPEAFRESVLWESNDILVALSHESPGSFLVYEKEHLGDIDADIFQLEMKYISRVVQKAVRRAFPEHAHNFVSCLMEGEHFTISVVVLHKESMTFPAEQRDFETLRVRILSFLDVQRLSLTC